MEDSGKSLRLLALFGLALSLAACGSDGKPDDDSDKTGPADPPVAEEWPKPKCDHPAGTWAVGFSPNGGDSMHYPVDEPPGTWTYTAGLELLETPGWMLASYNDGEYGIIALSKDAGCNWEVLGEVEGMGFPVLASRSGDTAYAWDWFSNHLLFIDAAKPASEAIEHREFPFDHTVSSTQVQGFASSATNPDEIAYFNDGGFIQYSSDGGKTWPREMTRTVPRQPGNEYGIFYHAEFDRNDLQHVVIGTIDVGLQYSFDGGVNWDVATISSVSSGDIFCYDVRHTPGDSDVLWALCMDLDESDGGATTQGRHIYRSGDGGLTFQIAVDSMPDKSMSNGTVLMPPPGRPNEIYYEFFSCFNISPNDDDVGGTDIYYFDLETGEVTEYWQTDMTGVHSAAFHPDDPDFIWFGLDNDPRC